MADALGNPNEVISGHPRPLGQAAVLRLTQAVAGQDNMIAYCPALVLGGDDGADQVDAWDQR